jgi:hypothetical protein
MSQAHSSAQNRVSGSPNGLWSSPRAHIDGDGSLVIFGHYLGPKASLIGDELESWIKVEAQHLDRLADQLRALLEHEVSAEA